MQTDIRPNEMDEKKRKEYWASLALRHCPGLGARSQLRLLLAFGSALAAFENFKSWPEFGISEKIVSEMRRESWRAPAGEEWKKAGKIAASAVLWTDDSYPGQLRNLPDAPILLYFHGDISLFKSPGIALIGSRNSSDRGREVAAWMGRALAATGIAVVSGMASGIDASAHQAALQEVGSSIGVLGTGIDLIYPKSNGALFEQMARNGLLVSEFAPGTPPYGNNFPIRNRLISGLSLAIVVIEAARKSGSLITAKYALDQNREVFAVPGSALDSHCVGCQDLVRQGARPIFNVDDILHDLAEILQPYKLAPVPDALCQDDFGPQRSEKNGQARKSPSGISLPAEKSGPSEGKVWENLADDSIVEGLVSDDVSRLVVNTLRKNGSMNIDALAGQLDICIEELNSILLGLEMLGIVKRLPGARIGLGR